jgi:hypothetical protein
MLGSGSSLSAPFVSVLGGLRRRKDGRWAEADKERPGRAFLNALLSRTNFFPLHTLPTRQQCQQVTG